METISQYSDNVRYQLAQQQLDQMFTKWITQDNVQSFVNKLIDEVHDPTNNILSPPPPIFINKMATPVSPSDKKPNSSGRIGTIGHTPPKSPSGNNKYHTLVNPVFEPMESKEEEKDLSSLTLTQKELTKEMTKKQHIPKFYYKLGKPLEEEVAKSNLQEINQVFGDLDEVTKEEFLPISQNVFKFPKFLNSLLFKRLDTEGRGKISKERFLQAWTEEYERIDVAKRMFMVLAKPGEPYITNEDFKPMLKELLETHPGLNFLQATPEFQDRYADTVVMRIFFVIDRNDDGRITYRDFKQSNFIKILYFVDEEEDINKVRDYFSYEHFYVLYCRFWELDNDHDFLIDKEDFSRYEGYALSRKTMDKIFEQVPRKFKSENPEKMWYEDFVWFMLCEEDKSTKRSLEYWYKIIDLDGNGIITPHEMEFFYEEQVQRLQSLNHEPILFNDLLWQMNDMISPENEANFTFDELWSRKDNVGIFFNCLCNLNKLISYETRDLFALKHQTTENPDYSEWDLFAKGEYERLAMEEENPEDSDVIDTMDNMDTQADGSEDFNQPRED